MSLSSTCIGWTARTISIQSPTTAHLSLKEICKTIRSFDAFAIRLISSALAESFVSHCLPRAIHPRSFITEENQGWLTGEAKAIRTCFNREMAFRHTTGCKKAWEGEYSLTQINLLLNELKQLMGTKIAQCFSMPDNFIQSGIHFHLSEFNPTNILETATKKAGIDLSWRNVPSNYTLSLEPVKIEQTQLILSIIHTTDCGEIAREQFTIEELENEWMTTPGKGPS